MTWRRHLPALRAALVVLAAACALLWPMVRAALTSEERFHEWDVPEQYWPDLVYLCGALHDGELPAWNPYDRAGYPYAADPQAGAYHPLNWAICAVAGRSPSPSWAELRVFVGFVMAGLFGLLWLRRYRLPWSAAVVGAVAMQAAPFMRHNWELNLTAALAYLPLMLWAADRAAVERRARDGALLALAAALCAWVGSPPALWLAGTYAGGFWVARLAGEVLREPGRRREVLVAGLRTGLVAAALGAGLTLVVLEPAALLARHSVQAGRSFESIAEGGLRLDDLSALVAPRPGNHLYVGLLVLALAPFAFLARPHPRAPSLRGAGEGLGVRLPCRFFHLAVAIAAVLLALGSNGPLFGLAFDWVPGVALFRLPHRYEAWLGPALGALAAAGLAWLTGLAAARRPGLAKLLAPWSAAAHLALGAAIAALLLLDVTRGLPPDRHTRPGPHPCRPEAADAALARAPGAGLGERYIDEFSISCRSGTRLRRRDLRGYQDPLLLASYERVMAALAEHPRLAEQYGVRHVLTGPHFIHGWGRHYLPPPAALRAMPGVRDLSAGVLELPATLPPAYWVPLDRVERVRDRPAALRRLEQLAPAAVAILDGAVTGGERERQHEHEHERETLAGLDERAAEPSEMVAASSFDLRRDGLVARVAAPAPGVVVVNEAWYPGWRARVDGVEALIYRANALVRAVFVERGDHRLEMTYRPRDVVALRWVFCLAWVLAALTLALPTRGSAGHGPRRRAR